MSLRAQIRALGLYLLIAVPLVVGLLLYMFLVPTQHWIRVDIKWWGLAGATAVSFGYLVYCSKRFWRKAVLWLSVTTLLLVHLIVSIALLKRVDRVPLILFGFLPMVQIPIMLAAVVWIVQKSERSRGE